MELPENISQLIVNARVYAEGRSFRFEVSTMSDVESAIKLVSVKLTN